MLIAWLKIKTKHLLSTGVLTTLAQNLTKLVYEICLIPIVLWGKLETSSWFLLYIGSAQLIRTYVFLKIGFWWKNPLPSTLRCLRKLLYQYSRAIWSILEVLNTIFYIFVQALSRKFEVIEEKCTKAYLWSVFLQTNQMWVIWLSFLSIKFSTQRCTFFG